MLGRLVCRSAVSVCCLSPRQPRIPVRALFADDAGAVDPALRCQRPVKRSSLRRRSTTASPTASTGQRARVGSGGRRRCAPIKGGSRLGIPSPPAIWNPKTHFIGTPTIEDAEKLQGLPAWWTFPALLVERGHRRRWVLVGNAVVPAMAAWLGRPPETDGGRRLPDESLMPARRGLGPRRGKRARWHVDASLYPLVETDRASCRSSSTSSCLSRNAPPLAFCIEPERKNAIPAVVPCRRAGASRRKPRRPGERTR